MSYFHQIFFHEIYFTLNNKNHIKTIHHESDRMQNRINAPNTVYTYTTFFHRNIICHKRYGTLRSNILSDHASLISFGKIKFFLKLPFFGGKNF